MTREEYNQNPNLCLNCKQPIFCQVNESVSSVKRKKFCNHSCAATYNNHQRPKKQVFCQKCGKLIGEGYDLFYRRKYCEECNPTNVDWKNKTYGELKELRSYQVNSRIRELSRLQYLKSHPNATCAVCGYNKHIEIHHIKGISTFPDNATIDEINNDNNLIGLCPNHHWEIENGMIDISNYLENKIKEV